MNNKTNAYVKDFLKSDYHAIFLVHRRVMTVLYKKYLLTGYKIELLLVICKLCDYRQGTEIVGSKIREKVSKRFERVLGSMLSDLVRDGYIYDRRKDGANKQAWHYISLTSLGLEFYGLWDKTLKELVKEEKDQLIISISNTQKRDSNKSRIYSVRKKKGPGLVPPPTDV